MKSFEDLLNNSPNKISYLDKFKVQEYQTLFPYNWEALDQHRCPICFNKLKFPKNKKIAFCNSKKHPKSFVIKVENIKKHDNHYLNNNHSS